MNRPQLFSRALAIMFRSGSIWLVALPEAALNVAADLVLPGASFAETIGKLLVGLVAAAFLAGAQEYYREVVELKGLANGSVHVYDF